MSIGVSGVPQGGKSRPTMYSTNIDDIIAEIENPSYDSIWIHIPYRGTLQLTDKITLPTGGDQVIKLTGLGMNETLIKALLNTDLLYSQENNWDNSPLILETENIGLVSNDDELLTGVDGDGSFWVPQCKSTRFDIDGNDNTKCIKWGGGGADPIFGYTMGCRYNHIGGVTTNYAVRIWLENYISISDSWLLKEAAGGDVGYLYEMGGTKASFKNTIVHQWQNRNITSALWSVGNITTEGLLEIDGVYCNQSGGSASLTNALVRNDNSFGDDCRVVIDGSIKMLSSGEHINKLYYNNRTAVRSKFNGIFGWIELAVPSKLTQTYFYRSTSSTEIVLADDTLTDTGWNTRLVDLDKWTKMVLHGNLNSDGNYTTQVHLYNETDGESLGYYEWAGNAEENFESDPIGLIELANATGQKVCSIYMKTSNGGGTSIRAKSVSVTFSR